MPQRSEPEILADLIRLHSTLESDADALRRHEPHDSPLIKRKHEQAELIEQTRAALHRYVVARGKVQLTMPRAPLNLWTGACFAAGSVATGIAMLFGFPLSIALAAALLIITGASILIDHKHL
jgi:hypothetical protein